MSVPTPTGTGTYVEPSRLARLDARLLHGPLRGRRRTVWLVALVVVVAALAVIVAVSAVDVAQRANATRDAADAERTARASLERLLTYDAADLAPTRRAIDELTDGIFRDEFTSVFTQVVTPNALEQRARSAAEVREAGVVSAEPGRVVVLLFLNQTTSSTQLPGDRVDTIQARATMTWSGERWIVSGLDQV